MYMYLPPKITILGGTRTANSSLLTSTHSENFPFLIVNRKGKGGKSITPNTRSTPKRSSVIANQPITHFRYLTRSHYFWYHRHHVGVIKRRDVQTQNSWTNNPPPPPKLSLWLLQAIVMSHQLSWLQSSEDHDNREKYVNNPWINSSPRLTLNGSDRLLHISPNILYTT